MLTLRPSNATSLRFRPFYVIRTVARIKPFCDADLLPVPSNYDPTGHTRSFRFMRTTARTSLTAGNAFFSVRENVARYTCFSATQSNTYLRKLPSKNDHRRWECSYMWKWYRCWTYVRIGLSTPFWLVVQPMFSLNIMLIDNYSALYSSR